MITCRDSDIPVGKVEYITNMDVLIHNIKISELEEKDKEIEQLKSQLQQKENIIKEVREKINQYEFITGYYDACYDEIYDTYSNDNVKEELLEVLDKENKQ